MSIGEFVWALIAYCAALRASVTSWGRTRQHNLDEGGVAGSAHRFWLGADVVYDPPPAPLEECTQTAARLGLRLIRESDHDHLQPLGWPRG